MSRIRRPFLALLICSLLVPALPACAANSVKNLPANYRHWIEAEVPYIITSEERKQFLSLTTDEQRDSFIAGFWRIRNPDSTSELNPYKEEHYRRLSYANEHFGDVKYEDGWRTAMGHIYIVLGPPKQRAVYHEQANLRPIEIWFYQGENPALPPYFYVLFYKHSAAEPWQLYSPTQDGPVELVTTGESQNDNKMALRFIRKSAGDEVAKIACTLIPGEPVDFDNFSPTMESDMLLATINGLADNPLTKQRLEANRLREHVTTSIFVGDPDLAFGYQVVRDEKGRTTLSCELALEHPDSRLLGHQPGGNSYYDLTERISVMSPDGKTAYDQEDQLTGKLTEAQAEIAKKKRFAAEARLPLAPGKYFLAATLTNNINHIASRKQVTVVVPDVKPDDLGISSLLAYAAPAAVPDPHGLLPFSISGLRFTPRGAQMVEISHGDDLRLVFQLWVGSNAPQSASANKIHLRYVFGSVAAFHDKPAEEQEDLDASNHDRAGNLLTGHKIDTSTLGPGTYRLVVDATRESDHRTAYAAINFRVVPLSDFVDEWTAYGPPDPGGIGVDDLKRGLSAEASGAETRAQDFYAEALAESPTDIRPIERLAALLNRDGNTGELAGLTQRPILAHTAVPPETLLEIAQALQARGNRKEEVTLLETQIKLQPPDTRLYQTLAEACEAIGETNRAHELRVLAREMK